MPLYYFYTDDGTRRTQADEGMDLDGPVEARRAVLASLPDMARDVIPDGDERTICASAKDAEGHVVYSATLTLVGKWG